MSELGPCPRCGAPMTETIGALGEAACGKCHARFLDADVVELLREAHLRIDASLLREMARAGSPSAPCPRCRTPLRLQRVRSVAVDLCPGCGGMLLDVGELLALTRGEVREVAAPAVAPASLELADAPPPAPPALRWAICCTSCDAEIDANAVCYLVNDRPWCESCAAAAGLGGARGVVSLVVSSIVSLLLVPLSFVGLRRRGWRSSNQIATPFTPSSSLPARTVIEKLAPGEASLRAARFARRVPR